MNNFHWTQKFATQKYCPLNVSWKGLYTLMTRYHTCFNVEISIGFQLWRANTSGATTVTIASHRSMAKSQTHSSLLHSCFKILLKKSSVQSRWHTRSHFANDQQQKSFTEYCQGKCSRDEKLTHTQQVLSLSVLVDGTSQELQPCEQNTWKKKHGKKV